MRSLPTGSAETRGSCPSAGASATVRRLDRARTMGRKHKNRGHGEKTRARRPCPLCSECLVRFPPSDTHLTRASSSEHGWSRNVLALQIESGLPARQGKAVTNFKETLPPPQSGPVAEAHEKVTLGQEGFRRGERRPRPLPPPKRTMDWERPLQTRQFLPASSGTDSASTDRRPERVASGAKSG
jgi:hypothetical protein